MITTQQLQLLKEGNKNAFEALYRGYNARIYNFCPFYGEQCRGGERYHTRYFSPYLGEAA